MGFFSGFSDFLKGAVGNNLENNPDDVKKTKQNLNQLGFFEEDTENKFITRELDTGIKRFQNDHNLRVDGVLFPGGETEKSIASRLQNRDDTKKHRNTLFNERKNARKSDIFNFNDTDKYHSFATIDEYHRRNKSDTAQSPFIASFGQLAQNVDATGMAIREKDHLPPASSVASKDNETHTPPKPTKKPLSPKETEKLKAARESAKNNLAYFKKKNLKLSEKYFDHYLDGSGEPLTISTEEIKASPRLTKAVQKNRKSFEDSLVHGKVTGKNGTILSPFKDQILNLKDGETIDLATKKSDSSKQPAGDVWDQDLQPLFQIPIFAPIKGLDKDPDQSLSTGSVKVRSLGDLKATRKGDEIEISGDVYHTLVDTYDFHTDKPHKKVFFGKKKMLADKGSAKVFKITGVQPEKVKGTFTIKNNNIQNTAFDWSDNDF